MNIERLDGKYAEVLADFVRRNPRYLSLPDFSRLQKNIEDRVTSRLQFDTLTYVFGGFTDGMLNCFVMLQVWEPGDPSAYTFCYGLCNPLQKELHDLGADKYPDPVIEVLNHGITVMEGLGLTVAYVHHSCDGTSRPGFLEDKRCLWSGYHATQFGVYPAGELPTVPALRKYVMPSPLPWDEAITCFIKR